ncbi:MAG: thiamine phosphate synthase [Chloroflexi bacterium]|nr:thiamine phosphate synthase [Chloroflexota bacterium]
MSLARPALCLVTDRRICVPADLAAAVEQAVSGGVTLVQVREKDLPAGELCELVARVLAAVAGRARVVVSDRLDVALAVGADGVHLPGSGLPVEAARRLTPSGFLIGRSVHRPEEAAAAEHAGADYVVLGTIFTTASKPGLAPAGPGLIAATRALCRLPILAIGGITAANAGDAIAAGADGVAAISAILADADPAGAAARLAAALGSKR